MKSLRRSTPEVRTRRSSGGVSAVNMCEVRVEEVMSSGSGYFGRGSGEEYGEEKDGCRCEGGVGDGERERARTAPAEGWRSRDGDVEVGVEGRDRRIG